MSTNKVVIITGGSSGIGYALAAKFKKEGYKVIITGRNQEKLEGAAIDLDSRGKSVFPYQADVSRWDDCERLVSYVADNFNRIDVLINNAGISMHASVSKMKPSVMENIMQINFFGTFYMTKLALPQIMKTKGSILGISSIAGFRGLPERSGYSASKFAMHGFLESLRTEMMKAGVHVQTVCPGFTKSNIRNTALTADGSAQGESPREEKKMMSAEEVAEITYKDFKKRKKYTVMTSQGKMVVFLNKWLPGFMDKMVLKNFEKEEGEIKL